GQSPHPLECLLEEAAASIVAIEIVTGFLHLHSEQVSRIEARINREQTLQTAQQQACAYQQDQGKRDLGNHQRAVRRPVMASGAAGILLQSGPWIAPRSFERGNQADDDADESDDAERKAEDRRVYSNCARSRQTGWAEG